MAGFRFTPLAFSFLFALSAHASPLQCANAVADSAAEAGTFPVLPASLNDRGEFHDANLPNGFVVPGATLHHIFHGDFRATNISVGNQSVRVEGLQSGLHTRQALDQFLAMRPDLRAFVQANPGLSHTYPNGVLRILMPEWAFAPHVRLHFKPHPTSQGSVALAPKSYFPTNWTQETILAAINEVAAHGELDPQSVPGKDERRIGTYQDVHLTVFVNIDEQGKHVMSAFPSGDQPDSPAAEKTGAAS